MRRIVPLLAASALLAAPSVAQASLTDLDPSWGGSGGNLAGTTTTDVGADADTITGIAIQADGKIVAVGYTVVNQIEKWTITRYNSDGSIDTAFADNAETLTGSFVDLACADRNARAQGVAIQPDGKIVVVGYAGLPGCTDDPAWTVVRLNADGTPDPTFGGAALYGAGNLPGMFTYLFEGDWSGRANAVVIQPDGQIVVAGSISIEGDEFGVARYNATDGSLDSTFSGDGQIRTGIQDSSEAFAVALQPDGKIVAAGKSFLYREPFEFAETDFALARYTSTGTLDSATFNPGGLGDSTQPGTVTTDFADDDDEGHGVVVGSDGKIVVAGFMTNFHDLDKDFALARYLDDGSLDPEFDTDGKVTTTFGTADEQANALVRQPDGKLIAGGFAKLTTDDFAMARYLTSGALDPDFDGDGKVTTDFAQHGNDRAYAMLLQPDTKIVLAGSRSASPPDYAAARYGVFPVPTTTTPPPVTTTVPSENPPPVTCGDTTDPVVSIASLQHKRLYAKGHLATVKITATDNGTLTTDPSRPRVQVSTLRAGKFKVTATAVDSCGNRATKRFNYRVVGGPDIKILSPANCVRSSVTANVRIVGGAALRRVMVTIGGRKVFLGTKRTIRVSAETSLMSASTHGIAVYVRDRVGHRRHASARFSVCPPPKALFTG